MFDYLLHLSVLICIYGVLAVSLNLVAGHAGLVSLAQAAFFGIGAYSTAIVTTEFGGHFLTGLAAGVTIALASSWVVSIVSFRMVDDYFVIATFGLQVLFFQMVNNTVISGGASGIGGIPRPNLFGWRIDSQFDFGIVAACFAIAAIAVCHRIATSPFGRILHAIREDEVFAQAMGKNVASAKACAFATSALLSAIAGSLYAHYVGFIDPSSFSVTESILILSMVIIGGAGSTLGSIVGATLLVVLPELLRLVGFSGAFAGNAREITYGLVLILVMMFRPSGIFGRYQFGR